MIGLYIVIFFLFLSILQPILFITVGEEYKYEVLFGPFKLGKASLKTEKIEVINNQEVYHFRFYVKTSKLGDRLYKIRDEINTWISTNNLSLIKQEKNIREKNFRRQSTTTITNNIATTNKRIRPIKIHLSSGSKYCLFIK